MLVEEAGRRLGNLFTFVTLQPHRKDTTKNIKAIYLHLSIFCTLQPHGKDTMKNKKAIYLQFKNSKQLICIIYICYTIKKMKILWRFIGQGKTFPILFALFEHFIFLGEMVWVGWLVVDDL